MKKIFFLIIILVLATLFTVFFGWVDLKLTLRQQYIEDMKLKEGGFVGFTEISAPGGFPFSFLCYGLCPWRFNNVHFIINVFFTTVLIMFIILTVRFLFKKRKLKIQRACLYKLKFFVVFRLVEEKIGRLSLFFHTMAKSGQSQKERTKGALFMWNCRWGNFSRPERGRG